jgi:hypothetical protein
VYLHRYIYISVNPYNSTHLSIYLSLNTRIILSREALISHLISHEAGKIPCLFCPLFPHQSEYM